MKGELVYYLSKIKGMEVIETTNLKRVIGEVNAVYQTRKQKERSDNPAEHQGLSPYIIDPEMVSLMRDDAVILHPLPRNEELSPEVDELPQAKYFDEMYYGELIRRALLVKIAYDNFRV